MPSAANADPSNILAMLPPPTWRQRFERIGRRALMWCVAKCWAVRPSAVQGSLQRILLVRLDQRVGNMVMLTPLIESVLARFPQAKIDVLGSATARVLLEHDPRVHAYHVFRKRALLHRDGPLAMPRRLRAHHYDVAIDAGNPTDPSLTQAVLVRLSGARHTVGFAHRDFGTMYSACVPAPSQDDAAVMHEIGLRAQLLSALPGDAIIQHTHLHAGVWQSAKTQHANARDKNDNWDNFARTLTLQAYGVVNIGARLHEKRVDAPTYAVWCKLLVQAQLIPVMTYGPGEFDCAQQVHALVPQSILAPPTNLSQLAYVLHFAHLVVTCDTGPMHVSVALDVPTCGVFVSTDPKRYGYSHPPHAVVDARRGWCDGDRLHMQAWIRCCGAR